MAFLKSFRYCLVFVVAFFGLFDATAQEDFNVVVSTGHRAGIATVDFSPNQRFIATGSDDHTIRIWDRTLLQEYKVLYGHQHTIQYVQFSSDNKYLVSVDHAGMVYVWEVDGDGTPIQKIQGDAYSTVVQYLEDGSNEHKLLLRRGQKLEIINMLSGKKLYDLPLGSAMEAAIYPSGNRVSVFQHNPQRNAGELKIYETQKGELQDSIPLDFIGLSMNTTVNRKETVLAGVFTIGRNRFLKAWNLKTKKRLLNIKIEPAYQVVALQFSPDGNDLLMMDRSASVFVYSTQTGKLKKTIKDFIINLKEGDRLQAISGSCLELSRDGKVLAMSVLTKNAPGSPFLRGNFVGVLLLDYKKEKQLGYLNNYFKSIDHVQGGPQDNYILSFNHTDRDYGARLWNLKEGDLQQFIPATIRVATTPDAKYVALQELGDTSMMLRVRRLPSMRLIFEQSMSGKNVCNLAIHPKGETVAVEWAYVDLKDWRNNAFYIDFINTKTGERDQRIELTMEQKSMMTIATFSFDPTGRYFISQNSKGFLVWDLETKALVCEHPIQVYYEYFLDFIPNSTQILFSKTDVLAMDPASITSKTPVSFYALDYTSGKIINEWKTEEDGIIFCGHFNKEGTHLVTGHGGHLRFEVEFCAKLWNWADQSVACTLDHPKNGHQGDVHKIWFGRKGKRIYTASEDGFIKTWEVDTVKGACRLQASFIAMNELDYLIMDPNDYYKSSRGNHDGIAFRYKGQLFGLDQFDIYKNKPHKVLESLGASKYVLKLYKSAWEKRVQRLGFATANVEQIPYMPSLKIVDKLELPVATEKMNISFDVQAQDSLYNLNRLMVTVNGVPLWGAKGINLSPLKLQKLTEKVEIPLSYGRNTIKVWVVNQAGYTSVFEQFELNCIAQPSKPSLYILGIGVSDFQDSTRNLQFAKKDMTDFVDSIQQTNMYASIKTNLFANQEAKADVILNAGSFLKKADVNDRVILYVSTHGLLDDELNYYLAMHDTNFENPANGGLLYEKLEGLLDGIDCRNRLVLIDACHSGEVDKDELVERKTIPHNDGGAITQQSKSGTTLVRPKMGMQNSFTYMQQLFNDVSHQTGATIIAAASGYEFALESDLWQNGVFTYSILDGLKTQQMDSDRDQWISVKELKRHVTQQVLELTNGRQHPTTRHENALNNFKWYYYKN